MLNIVCFGNLCVDEASASLQQMDLINKNKHLYNYTDSALMA